MTLCISDKAEEFRIEISGPFMATAVADAGTAWKAALLANIPRRISVDIERMTGYDEAGYRLLRDMHAHGTHICAGTPSSLHFFEQISGALITDNSVFLDESTLSGRRRKANEEIVAIHSRAKASGE
jgi:hypothetical protein